jgi:hypothetical protein
MLRCWLRAQRVHRRLSGGGTLLVSACLAPLATTTGVRRRCPCRGELDLRSHIHPQQVACQKSAAQRSVAPDFFEDLTARSLPLGIRVAQLSLCV